jgi:hypothetical protein
MKELQKILDNKNATTLIVVLIVLVAVYFMFFKKKDGPSWWGSLFGGEEKKYNYAQNIPGNPPASTSGGNANNQQLSDSEIAEINDITERFISDTNGLSWGVRDENLYNRFANEVSDRVFVGVYNLYRDKQKQSLRGVLETERYNPLGAIYYSYIPDIIKRFNALKLS